MKRLRVAILSFAHPHAHGWARALGQSDCAELASIWDDAPERGRAAAAAYRAPCTNRLNDILERDDIHAVAICSETCRHAELTIDSAGARKHVLCEKPMALSIGDCDRMIAAVKDAGVTYMQSFPKRCDPVNIKAKELVDAGRIGRIGLVRVRHGHGFALSGRLQGTWFVDPSKAGAGAFLDEGVHGADLLRWFIGEPSGAHAVIFRLLDGLDVDDNGAAIYRFAGGSVAELAASWTWQAATNSVEIYGDKGTIIIQGTDNASKDMTGPDCLKMYCSDFPARKWQIIDAPCGFKSENFQGLVMQEFVKCLVSGAPPPATAEDGKGALAMILMAYRAAGWRRWDASEES